MLIHHEHYVAELGRLAGIREEIAAYRFAASARRAADAKPRRSRFATIFRRFATSSAHAAAQPARFEAGE